MTGVRRASDLFPLNRDLILRKAQPMDRIPEG
jgi:hypothetical protein